MVSARFAILDRLVEIVPLLLAFVLAALAEGIAERARRLKQFLPHRPAT